MGVLGNIGDKFERTEREVEKDLYRYLRSFQSNTVMSLEQDYKKVLTRVLEDKGLIENYDYFSYKITPKGIAYAERGWVLRNFQPIEKEEQRIKRHDKINLLIALAGVVAGALGLIFPRQDIPQRHSEHIEVKSMMRDTALYLPDNVDEVAQASDSTSKKDNIKRK